LTRPGWVKLLAVPVLKIQLYRLAIATPPWLSTPVVIVAVYVVPAARFTDGWNTSEFPLGAYSS